MEVFTIGHSNHSFEHFVDLLDAFQVECVADVRTVPKSRRWPHFRSDQLAHSLPTRGIDYVHMPGLGGWRRPMCGSRNGAWTNESFRGYADYALTEAFAGALAALAELAVRRRTVIMCSEALWWRCHRRLISDRLAADGWEVRHIASTGPATIHRLPEFATPLADGRILYPSEG